MFIFDSIRQSTQVARAPQPRGKQAHVNTKTPDRAPGAMHAMYGKVFYEFAFAVSLTRLTFVEKCNPMQECTKRQMADWRTFVVGFYYVHLNHFTCPLIMCHEAFALPKRTKCVLADKPCFIRVHPSSLYLNICAFRRPIALL